MTLQEQLEKGETVSLPMQPINGIKLTMAGLGFTMQDLDNNINGWDIDFNYYFTHPIYGTYRLYGSLWYGNFNLIKTEELL